jgi:hypothetical protein
MHGCAECAMGMEIVFGASDGILGHVGEMEAHFGLFGDSVNFDAPDGTPR